MTPIAAIELTAEEKLEIGALLVQGRAIVERVSPILYGEFKIREFRRDLSVPRLTRLLTASEQDVLQKIHNIEPKVLAGFVAMVTRIAEKSLFMGTDAEIDDLVQEGLQIILLTMLGYNGDYDLTTYFWNVVNRHFMDIDKYESRQPTCCHVEEMEFAQPDSDEEDDDHSHSLELLQYAMKCVRLTPLERMVLDLIVADEPSVYTEAARRVINPQTNKPFSKQSARNAHRSAQEKVQGVYNSLVARAHARHQCVA